MESLPTPRQEPGKFDVSRTPASSRAFQEALQIRTSVRHHEKLICASHHQHKNGGPSLDGLPSTNQATIANRPTLTSTRKKKEKKMSYSLVFPPQPEDFEALLDRVLTERYGAPSPNAPSRKRHLSTSGTSPVNKVIRPKMDVIEKEDVFIVSAELPGARKEDISLELHNGRLSISGQTKSSSDHSSGSVRLSERSFGSFTRTIAVPTSVSHEQIKASFKDGVLDVTVPKVKNTQAKSISIN
ncbi:hypothetical protein VP01_1958g5 [Puccinia sorghi]|uniref:SHSP domain-containing protein n=1 Tax=Puccinia sorghi TaxID=27349 RepID=A0A0L6VBZ4_9BASI|nr:hypothetical protein VP01_1958g5 [Puccinia sorghi]